VVQEPVTGPVHRLLGPRPVYFVGSTRLDGSHHLCAATNVTSVSVDPPQVVVALWPAWETTGNVLRTRTLTLSPATDGQLPAVLTAGHHYSGVRLPEGVDKFRATGLTPFVPLPGHPAGVLESPAVLACDVVQVMPDAGDHVLVIARVVAAFRQTGSVSVDLAVDLAGTLPLMQVAGLSFAVARPLATGGSTPRRIGTDQEG
jgi:flavin reductase (DIM6/NTAB) family NADH-FMN oxidoreductase RutF